MTEFTIANMRCGHCAGTITKALQAQDPAARVAVDLAQKKVLVESTQDRATLAAALEQAGYPAT